MKIESIMTATDGSSAARAALSWSGQLARRRHARLDVVHVVSMPQAEMPPELFDECLADAASHLDEWIDEAGVADEVDHRIVEEGTASERITQLAAQAAPDLLVLGTRGSSGLTRLGLGSTAHQVVHGYHGALAAVHERSPLEDATQVVVGVDGSAGSERALRWAADLSERLDTKPLAVFVDQPLAATPPGIERRGRAQRSRDAVVEQVDALDGVELRVMDGDPVDQLAAVAATFPSSILVVGTRSHGVVHHQFLGRVPVELLHHSHRPVVVIPAA
jgi:nucleotide-binding universal stress UspA family protein